MRDTYYKVTYLDKECTFIYYDEAVRLYNDLVSTNYDAHIYKVHTTELSPGVDLQVKSIEIFPGVDVIEDDCNDQVD